MLLTACAGGGGGGTGPGPNLQATAFHLGTTLVYQDSVKVERQQDQEFKNMSAFGLSGTSGPESSTHPLSFSNVDRAYGYGLSGAGTTIAVLDSGFNTQAQFTAGSAFPDLQQKRTAGLLEFQGETNPRLYHQATHITHVQCMSDVGLAFDRDIKI